VEPRWRPSPRNATSSADPTTHPLRTQCYVPRVDRWSSKLTILRRRQPLQPEENRGLGAGGRTRDERAVEKLAAALVDQDLEPLDAHDLRARALRDVAA
jgi:hypothetical protein